MADSNGSVARWMVWIWTGLLLLVLSALAAQTLAIAGTQERVARLEAQYEMIREDLRDIKRAVGAIGGQ